MGAEPEMVACPSCRAVLRVPPGAEAVRCPRCKTVLNLGTPAPLPVARPAVPLPFGRATTPQDPAEPIYDEPPTPAKAAKKRAKLIKDEDPVEEHQRQLRREAARKAEEEQERDERKLARLTEQCLPARRGVRCLAWGAGFYAGALALSFLYATAYLIGFTALMTPILYLAAMLGAANWVLSTVGLGLCCGGPRAVRPMAASALIFAAAHVVLFGVQMALTLSRFGDISRQAELNAIQVLMTFDILGAVSNLSVLSDFPGYVIAGHPVQWVGTAGGVLELTRLVMIGMLCQHYAAEGKDVELGFRSLKFIARVFAVVLIATAIKAGVKVLVDGAGYDSSAAKFGAAAVSMASAGLFLSLAVTLVVQAIVMQDTAEIIDPRRFGAKRIVSSTV